MFADGEIQVTDDGIARKSKDEVSASIVEVLQHLFTATKSVHMYPPESPSAMSMVETAYQVVLDMIPTDGSFDLSFIENKFLVNGEMLDEALQKKGILQKFHELLKARKLSSVTFWSGLTMEELRKFLVVLGAKVPMVETEDQVALYKELEEEGIKHIEVDEQIYVAISKREKVVDARAAVEREEDTALKLLKDEVFTRFLAGEVSLTDLDPATTKEIMSDPDRMISMLQGVISAKGWDTELKTLPFRIDETRGILERVSALIEQVDDPLVRSKLGREVSKITQEMETPQLTEILLTSAGRAGAKPSFMPKVVLPLLSDVKLSAVVESAVDEHKRLSEQETGNEWPSKRMMALESILNDALASAGGEMAQRLADRLRKTGVDEALTEKAASKSGVELAKLLIAGGEVELCDRASGPTLAAAATYLFENEKDDTGSLVIEKIAEKFMKLSSDSRSVAARQLWGLFKALKDLGKEAFAADLMNTVSETLEEEKAVVSTFADLTKTMEKVTAGGEATVAAGVLESLNLGSKMPVSIEAIEKLMTADAGKVVRAIFQSGDKLAEEAISKVLLGMEDQAVPALIETALGATNEEMLDSVAESLMRMKSDPIPLIAARFQLVEIEPFQLINLIKLVATLGDEDSASVFTPLLASEDVEIRGEVIRALGRLGGKQALHMMLSESVETDVILKTAAVRELGKFHDYLAVKRLIEIVTHKEKGELPEDELVMIAACRSIGDLRVHQAVPILMDIAKSRKSHEAYSEKLRAVATAILGMVGGNDAHKELRELLKDPSLLIRSTARKALSG
ncbi:MAG: hypothetical protein CVT63_02200 [Candidatus Anoxymicrobium japonicum]|uniref:HEAT repeat domain-containing protein n=1 Tax=Candidatus Anoxymicrobium japonicum TaxID=2013648 RepID=A0A2N3G7K0_9ACTN|nr:MAG: hypothetical protein CVT63_02200 [Candidatus Anoxymicrobium japonicum]